MCKLLYRCTSETLISHILLFQFDPELVFVCAGFDSAIGDPEVNNISSNLSNCCELVVYLSLSGKPCTNNDTICTE